MARRRSGARLVAAVILAVILPCLLILRSPAPAAHAAGSGNVLVVVAHPDDEGLAMSGVIANARAAGRRVYVAITTNGDQGGAGTTSTAYCGASTSTGRGAAELGLLRDGETIGAMGELGLSWSANLNSTDIFFLGYPDSKLKNVAGSSGGITSDGTGLHHTYARAGNGSSSDSCAGDFGYLWTGGTHSALTKSAMATDFDRLIAKTQPTDVYTHMTWEGHADHGEVADQVAAAAARSGLALTVHGTIIHPEGTETCDELTDFRWPNPAGSKTSNPVARMSGTTDFTAPQTPACSTNPTGTSWGSDGAPDEKLTVPASMQTSSESTNLKWKVIAHYGSQINCGQSGGEYHWSCGYMHAFVKHDEVFWVTGYNGGGPPPDTTPPSKPVRPSATALDKAASIDLDPLNGEDDLDAYTLQRKLTSQGSGSWSSVKTGITGWPQTNTGLTNGTSYDYRVIAIDNAGNTSTPSDPVTVTPGDTTPPAKPATPTAEALDAAARISLSPRNTEADLGSYTLQRKPSSAPASAWAAVKTGLKDWPVIDADLANGTSYDHRVIAVDNAGNQSSPSNAVSVKPAGPTPPPGPSTTPAPAVTPTPISTVEPTGIAAVSDVLAPTASFRRPKGLTVQKLRSRGVMVRVRCSEACTLTAQLDLLVTFRDKAGKKRVNARLLGRSAPVSLAKAGKATVTVRLSAVGRGLLASKRGRLKLSVEAVDPAGNHASAIRKLRFTR